MSISEFAIGTAHQSVPSPVIELQADNISYLASCGKEKHPVVYAENSLVGCNKLEGVFRHVEIIYAVVRISYQKASSLSAEMKFARMCPSAVQTQPESKIPRRFLGEIE